MASTTSLFNGMSGILANGTLLDVVGNNIANVNTTAYKSSRLQFASTFSKTLSSGSAPSGATGGANPTQVGQGVHIGGTQRNFNAGSLNPTGVSTDLAINGAGFFIIQSADETLYTRNGAFQLDANGNMVSIDGGLVQGYGVDENFNIVNGSLSAMNVPIGTMTIAEATENVQMGGNLNAGGDVASTGSIITLDALQALAGAVPPPFAPPFADATTRLVDLDDGTGSAMFTDGQTVEMSGAEKGGRSVPEATLDVDDTTTVADFMDFLAQALGIDASVAAEPGGVSIDSTTGVITIEGNLGVDNDLDVDGTNLTILDDAGLVVDRPFEMTKDVAADGESVRTSFLVYDSLGQTIQVDLTAVLTSKANTGTQWRYYTESADATGVDLRLSTGELFFDPNGQLTNTDAIEVEINREGTGAVDPMSVDLSFGSGTDALTAFSDSTSQLAALFVDGAPFGTLVGFSVGIDGTISGTFDNGEFRNLGQVALSIFPNSEGLLDVGDNYFRPGPNSGVSRNVEPLTFGSGSILGGTLELSNVELSQEFINMILATTGYSASGRVIDTSNDLIQQLLLIGR